MMKRARGTDTLSLISALMMKDSLAISLLLVFLFIAASGASAQVFSLIYQFRPGPGGLTPQAGVIFDGSGNLYGTTFNDGEFASGTVFGINPAGKEKAIYSFTGINGDGAFPYYGTLARDSAGNLYGTTSQGGLYNQSCLFGCGTVFKVDTSGKETVLHEFTNSNGDGNRPDAGVVRDSLGNLYGMSTFGGSVGAGMLFKIDTSGNETVLYSFTGSNDGGYPYAGLTLDPQGNLYGTTSSGGPSFAGNVLKVDPNGNETVLYSFTGGLDGGSPESNLLRDVTGNLYGTTSSGGSFRLGTVFKIDPNGQETVLYNFAGGSDGANPFAGLVRDSAGNLYGTTPIGGTSDFGIVFRIDPAGNETILHTFSGPDGKAPYGTLAIHGAALYGTASAGGAYGGGVVFKITR